MLMNISYAIVFIRKLVYYRAVTFWCTWAKETQCVTHTAINNKKEDEK